MPNLRFKGFTDDWEQRKLIDGCEYVDYRGKTPNKTENGVFLVTAKNVKAGYIDYEASQEYIAEEDYDEVMHRGMPQIGDVLITTEAPCGNVAQVDREDIALAQRIIKYRGHENQIDNTYLKHYLLTPYFQRVLESKSSGGTVQGIKGSILHQQIIRHPSFEEQVKIGRHLDSIDNLIALHQRKCDELQKVKKYMLQKMFPKKGEKVPEIRFAGFTDDWEQRKLGDIVSFSKGSGYSKADLQNTGTPIILYGRLYTKYETVISKVDTFADEKPNSVFSKGGEVIVPASGETAEDISVAAVVDQSGVMLGGDLNIITPPRELDSTFLAISISNGKPHSDMAKMAQGKSVVHLHNSDLAKIDLPYPSYEEQREISQHFKTLDNLITLHQRRHDTLKEIKKYMLQNMFPKK